MSVYLLMPCSAEQKKDLRRASWDDGPVCARNTSPSIHSFRNLRESSGRWGSGRCRWPAGALHGPHRPVFGTPCSGWRHVRRDNVASGGTNGPGGLLGGRASR